MAFDVNIQSKEDGFIYYTAILAGFHRNAVHINNGIQRIQLSVLPLSDLLFYGVGDLRYQRGRHIRVVHFFEGGDDFTGGHAFGVEGQNLAVDLRNAPLVLLNQLRFKGISRSRGVLISISPSSHNTVFDE